MDKSVLAVEISDIMSWDLDEIEQEIEREIRCPGIHVKEDWEAKSRREINDFERFYSTSTAFIYDLAVRGLGDSRKQLRSSISRSLEKYFGTTRDVRLLDYGGGTGEDCLYFSKRCQQVSYFDLHGITNTFANARFVRHKAPVNVLYNMESYVGSLDAVVSIEFLDRVTDPLKHLDTAVRLLRPGGIIFLNRTAEFTSKGRPWPTHQHLEYQSKLVDLMEERDCRLIEVLDHQVHVFVKLVPVTTIVPIYNAFGHTSRLLESVMQTDPGYPCNWLLINDGSPDNRIGELLAGFRESFPGRCEIIDRAANLGFVQTCNEGIKNSGTTDVILLNSDTLVYDDWLARLVKVAYSDPSIGTVTPLSNNCSAYSVFRHISPENAMNQVLLDLELDPLEIPSGVGFCLYIKRSVIDRVGVLDPVFGIGYGEETEFCQRSGKAGYRNVLARNCFIYHAGGASMAEAEVLPPGETLIPEHEAIVNARYPEYPEAVHKFISSGVIDHLDAYASRRYVQITSEVRPSIAFVVHTDIYNDNIIGGVENHIRDLIQALQGEFVFYTIFPQGQSLRVIAESDGVRSQVLWKHLTYNGLLEELRPSLVHVHHLRDSQPGFIHALCQWEGPKLFTIHDYNSVCKQYTLLDYRGAFCNVPEMPQCKICAQVLFQDGIATPLQQRLAHQMLIDSVDRVISPSKAALDIVRKVLEIPEDKVMIFPHPYSLERAAEPAVSSSEGLESDSQLVVGFIGYNAPHKGSALAGGIVAAVSPSEKFRFVMIGTIGESARGRDNVHWTGTFERKEVVDIIKSNSVDVIVLPSPWPETFSYTLTEAWAAGVPVVVGPLGAPAERVTNLGGGVVVPDYSVGAFASVLVQLGESRAWLAKLKVQARAVSLEDSFLEYKSLYRSMINKPPDGVRLFSGALELSATDSTSRNGFDWLDFAPPHVRVLWRLRHRLFQTGTRRGRIYLWVRDRMARRAR